MNAAKVLEDLKRRFPNEPEYHQAVEEVLSTIEEEYNKHPEFDKVNLIERLCIPDRVYQFRVTWTNAFPKMGIYTAMAVIFYKLNLIGTFAGVVLVHIVNTMMFMVWIPSGAFRTVHIQQEESARDVGASPLRTFLMVTLPMAKPGIIVASLYTFLGSMEEAQGSLLIGLPNVHTMPSELYGIIMSFPDTAGAVFAMILLVPSILLLVVFRKYLSADALSNGLKM